MNDEKDDMTKPLLRDDTFSFKCSSKADCFNQCCRDLNQFLMPYDIMRLKKSLGLSSGEFLEQYTISYIGPETGFPIISFRTDIAKEKECPFVTDVGCRVYSDRPASCRIYPLARALGRSRETGDLNEYFMLIQESHCHGFERGETWTPISWMENQGLAKYNDMNDRMMELISLKNIKRPGSLPIEESNYFYMACYDLDTFRNEIFTKGLLDDLNLEDETLKKIRDDDEELLILGLSWVKHILFGDDADSD